MLNEDHSVIWTIVQSRFWSTKLSSTSTKRYTVFSFLEWYNELAQLETTENAKNLLIYNIERWSLLHVFAVGLLLSLE